MSALLDSMRAGRHPIIAMIQLPPLPGSARYRGAGKQDVLAGAVADARVAAAAGMDGLMIQNLGDVPVGHGVSALQVAWMTMLAHEVRATAPLPMGLNFLENDAEAMLAVASAVGLDFVRLKVFVGAMVTAAGVVEGCAHRANALRTQLGRDDIAFFADVHDRTGVPLGQRPLLADVREAIDLGQADALVLTGSSFDESLVFHDQVRQRYTATPRILGGDSAVANLAVSFPLVDATMVSSSLKDSNDAFGRFVPAKVEDYMTEVRRLRDTVGEMRGDSTMNERST